MELGGEDVYMAAHQLQQQQEVFLQSERNASQTRRPTVGANKRRSQQPDTQQEETDPSKPNKPTKRAKRKKQNTFGARPYIVHCRIPEEVVWGPNGLRRRSATPSSSSDADEKTPPPSDTTLTDGVGHKPSLSSVLLSSTSVGPTSIPDLILTSTMAAFSLSTRPDPEMVLPTPQERSAKEQKRIRKQRREEARTLRAKTISHDDAPEDRIGVEHVRRMMACFYSQSVDVTSLLDEEVRGLNARSRVDGALGEKSRIKEEVRGKGGSVWQLETAATSASQKPRRSVVATAHAELESHEEFVRAHKDREMRASAFDRPGVIAGNEDPLYRSVLHRALSAIQKAKRASTVPEESAKGDDEKIESPAGATLSDEDMFARLFLRKPRRLRPAEFVDELGRVLEGLASPSELEGWFNRIDVENTGSVGWDELSAFLLSKGDHRGHVESRPFSLGIQLQPETCHPWNRHEGKITCVVSSPKTGRVYTGGEEGMILVWNEHTLRHHGVLHRGNSWIVGMRLSHNSSRLFACTSSRELLLFDLKGGTLLRVYNGRTVFAGEVGASYATESTPMILVGGTKPGHLAPRGERVCTNRADETEKLRRLLGQKGARSGPELTLSSGNARTIVVGASGERMHADELKRLTEVASEHHKGSDRCRVEQFLLVGLVDIPTSFEYHYSAHNNEIAFFGTRQGHVLLYVIPPTHEKFIKPLVTLNVHSAQINAIEVIPDLECALTCSDDCTLKLISMETGIVTRTYRGHKTGVLGFAFAHRTKLIVSHSSERSVLLWDYFQDTPIYALQEHASPLLSVCLDEREGHVYALSADNTIRISDLVSHQTLQTINHKRTLPTSALQAVNGPPETPAFCLMAYDTVRRRHLCCSSFPQMYQLRKAAAQFPPSYTGHISQVAALQYNASLRQLITFDLGLALVWDPFTGTSRFSFPYATNFGSTTSGSTGDGALLDEVRITAVGWDQTQRRLLVGFHNGMLVVWNYANGQPLNVIKDATIDYVAAAASYGTEVAAVGSTIMGDHATYVYGVGRYLMCVPESQQYTVSRTTKWEVPDEFGGITSLCRVTPSVFAVGTTSGAVIFYNVGMEQMEGRPMWMSEQALNTSDSAVDLIGSIQQRGDGELLVGGQAGRRVSNKMLGVSPRLAASRSTAFLDCGDSGSLRRSSSLVPPPPATSPSVAPSANSTSAVNRVERVFFLGQKKGNAVLAAHNDGHCGVWHLTKRNFLGGFFVTGGAPFDGEGLKSRVSVGVSNFALEEEACEAFAFSDDLGNICVWTLAFEEMPFVDCLKRHLKPSAHASTAPTALSCHKGSKEMVLALSEGSTKRVSCFKAHDAGTITGLVLLPALEGNSSSSKVFSYAGKGPVIISCSTDCTTKAFTIEGVCIGVFGSGPWNLYDAKTWSATASELPVEAPAQVGAEMGDTFTGPGGNLPGGITFASMMGKLSGARRYRDGGEPDMVDVLIAQEAFGINTSEVKRKRAERTKMKEARKREWIRRRNADSTSEGPDHSAEERDDEGARAVLDSLTVIPHVPVFAPPSISKHQPITYLAPSGAVLDSQLGAAPDVPSHTRQSKAFKVHARRRRAEAERRKQELKARQQTEEEMMDRSSVGGSRCASGMSSRHSNSPGTSRPSSQRSHTARVAYVEDSSSSGSGDEGSDVSDIALNEGHGANFHDHRGLQRGGIFRPMRPPNEGTSQHPPLTARRQALLKRKPHDQQVNQLDEDEDYAVDLSIQEFAFLSAGHVGGASPSSRLSARPGYSSTRPSPASAFTPKTPTLEAVTAQTGMVPLEAYAHREHLSPHQASPAPSRDVTDGAARLMSRSPRIRRPPKRSDATPSKSPDVELPTIAVSPSADQPSARHPKGHEGAIVRALSGVSMVVSEGHSSRQPSSIGGDIFPELLPADTTTTWTNPNALPLPTANKLIASTPSAPTLGFRRVGGVSFDAPIVRLATPHSGSGLPSSSPAPPTTLPTSGMDVRAPSDQPSSEPSDAFSTPRSPRGTLFGSALPPINAPPQIKGDVMQRALSHLREQQERLEQYGMSGRMRAVEQQLLHRAATSTAAQRATNGHKAEVTAVHDHLARIKGDGDSAAETNRRGALQDAFKSVQRLASQLIVTPVPPPRPPEGSWAAQEEARRAAASTGARRIGARGATYDESAGPSVTAPGVRSGARTARF